MIKLLNIEPAACGPHGYPYYENLRIHSQKGDWIY